MKQGILVLLLLYTFTSCGADEDSNDNIEESLDRVMQRSELGNCGLEVVNDYNAAYATCLEAKSRDDIYDCETGFENFRTRYPNINCNAQVGYGIDRETVTIKRADIDEMIEVIRNL